MQKINTVIHFCHTTLIIVPHACRYLLPVGMRAGEARGCRGVGGGGWKALSITLIVTQSGRVKQDDGENDRAYEDRRT